MNSPPRFFAAWRERHFYRVDLLAVVVIGLLAAAFLSPSLKDGFAFGPYDFDLALTSLTSGAFHAIHSPFNGDAVSQMIAWNTLDWQMIHHGQFPLWNQYSVLGMPQFLNFESSVLSLPDLLSYLVPLKFAYLVVVYVKLVLAGTGVYVFSRVLRVSVVGALFAGITFMFSGAFASWVTWPLSDVAAWSGWIFAFGVLAYRGHLRYLVGLAIAVAFSVYGGFPEANAMLAFVLVVAIVVSGAAMLIERQRIRWWGIARVMTGAIFGVALSAPLWLPGVHVVSAGHRVKEGHYVGLPLRTLPGLFTQGYFGMPIGSARAPFQLTRWNYYETVAYVGVVALVFLVFALIRCWRRPVVAGLFVALLFSLAMSYEPVAFHPLQSLTYRISTLSSIRFERMRIFSGFIVAVLSGIGVCELLGSWRDRRARRDLVLASGAVMCIVLSSIVTSLGDRLIGVNRSVRFSALLWPTVLVLVVFVAAVIGLRQPRQMFCRIVVGGALVAQVAYLFFAGVGIPTYSHSVYPVTSEVGQLQRIVGNSLVGLDGGNTDNVRLFSHIGFYPNVNIGYRIRLFGVHDPLVPSSYFASWPDQKAAPQAFGVGLFTPDVNSAALARRYGITYVIVAPGLVAPAGMDYVTTIAGERLYRVPDSSQFSLVAINGNSSIAHTIPFSYNGNGRYALSVNVPLTHSAHLLVMRVTGVPGWQVTVDGRPSTVQPYEDVMMSVALAPGHHRVVLSYWPRRLSEGIWLAVFAMVAMIVVLIARSLVPSMLRRRR